MKIRRRMGETKQIVQVNGGNILLFELAFRLLTLPLLLQAVAALFRLSVRASGYSYVTVSNLVSYLLRPVTIAILVLMAAILHQRAHEIARHHARCMVAHLLLRRKPEYLRSLSFQDIFRNAEVSLRMIGTQSASASSSIESSSGPLPASNDWI